MKHKYRALSALGALTATALALTACSGTNNDAGDGGTDTVRYLSYWTESEPTAEILKQVIADFEEETGITVEVQWQGRDLATALRPMLTSSDPKVDIIDTNCSGAISLLATTDQAADLGGVLSSEVPGEGKTVEEVLVPDVIPTGEYEGEMVCIPWQLTSNFDMWINAANHPGLADDPPRTWDEFIGALDAAGPGSLALDGTIDSYAAAWYVNLAVSAAGKGELAAAATDETGESFKKPAFVEAAEAVEQLVDGGYFSDGYTASKFPAIQQKWANNEADFILNGSWLPAEVAPYAAPEFEYASFPFPAFGEDGIRPMQVDSIGFSAIKNTPNLENAEKFIAFVLKQGYQTEVGEIAVPARPDADATEALRYVQQALTDDTVTFIASADGIPNVAPVWGAEVFNPLTQQLALGEISADEFIDQISAKTKEFWEIQG